MLDIGALRRMRMERGISMRQMACCLGYASPCSYFRIEHGLSQLKLEDALEISAILDVELGALLTVEKAEMNP